MTGPEPEVAFLAADMIVLHHGPTVPGQSGGRVTRVLLIERSDTKTWAVPGGKLDKGEEFLAAGVRELTEETGIEVDPGICYPTGVYDAPGRDPRGRYVSRAFGAELWGERPPPPRVQPGETDRVEWVPVDEAVKLEFFADHLTILLDAIDASGAVVRP